MDMSVKEASSVLSSVVNSLRAAKRLEEALKTAESAEQVVKEKTIEKDSLEVKVNELHIKLDALGLDIEAEEKRKMHVIDDASRIVEGERARSAEAQEDATRQVEDMEKQAGDRFRSLDASHLALTEQLDKEIESRREVLVVIESKLKVARDEMASTKERLG